MALEGKSAKALSRKGKAQLFLKRYDKAKANLLAAAKLEVGSSSRRSQRIQISTAQPQNAEVRKLLQKAIEQKKAVQLTR